MRDTSRVQRDHALFYVFTAHEIAIDVVEHLIAVDVAMVIRRRDGIRGGSRTSAARRSRLQSCGRQRSGARGRLVHPVPVMGSVVNAESVGVYVTVPADQVEGWLR